MRQVTQSVLKANMKKREPYGAHIVSFAEAKQPMLALSILERALLPAWQQQWRS
jgi:hypothetical protein